MLCPFGSACRRLRVDAQLGQLAHGVAAALLVGSGKQPRLQLLGS